MSEIALISARKNRLESAAKKGNKNAQIALELANSPNKFLSTVQIGITLIGILTGIYSGEKITTDVETFVGTFLILKPYDHSIAVGIVVVILTFFSLVLETISKLLCLYFCTRSFMLLNPFLFLAVAVFTSNPTPLSSIFTLNKLLL